MKNTLLMLLFAFSIFWQANAQNSQNTSLVGMWPYGPGNAVDSWDHYAILSLGRVLQIYDYSEPQQPQLKGELLLDDLAFAFAFDSNLVLVSGYKGLHFVDITDIMHPVLLSTLPSTNWVRDVELHNNYAYISGYEGSIGIVDYSNPANPFMAGFVETNLSSQEMVIADDILWLTSTYDGFSAWDISAPLAPVHIVTNTDYGNITGIEVFGQYLYVASGSQGLIVFEISNLPTLNMITNFPAYSFNAKLHRDGNLLALTNLFQGFNLFDLSNPAAPFSLSTFSSASPNRKVILNNGYAFHCNALDFNIFDVSNPQNIAQIANFELHDFTQYCEIRDNHLYANNASGSVMIFDVTNLQAPQKLKQIFLGDGHMVAHAKDGLLFYNIYNKLIISDVSTPSNPVVIDSLHSATTITHVLKQNNLLFVADYDTLRVFDISDIHAPLRLESYKLGSLRDMKVSGNRLFCAVSSGFLFIDFSNPQQIFRSETVENMSTNSIAVKDTLIYVVSNVYPSIADYSLKVFTVNSSGNIQQLSHMIQGRHFNYGVVDGDYLYVQESQVGIHIFDIHTPTPVLCGFYPVSIISSKISVENGILYVPKLHGVDFVANDLLTSSGGIFIERNNRLKLFPNPATDKISFHLDEDLAGEPLHYSIMPINGSVVAQGSLSSGQQQLDLEGLPAGIYVLKLQRKGGAYKSGMFVKQ
ncbi:MAG: T9SS type A sorting domain-containing protein [Bacteroidetes bacterium]|nr:T9SS type A sorting domain-containing protein [Bacteroidota bacterium]